MDEPLGEKELFDAARALPEDERDRFLEEQCPDPALRERVRSLLAHADAAGEGFLADVLRGGMQEAQEAQASPAAPEAVGEFRILGRLGVGGMGVVYLAEDMTLRRRVALKVLAPHLADSEHDRARFKHEARVVARLSHPNIVPVYMFGERDGALYIVSELIEGESLQARLARLREERLGRRACLPAREAASIAAGVADALEHAHRLGVIHRDVKPSNILLAEDGAPRLTDFGIAKLLSDEAPVTSAGAGTAHYMSPEQAEAEAAQIDHRSDIFSLGVVLYEAVTGRVPFDGTTREQVLRALRTAEARPPRQVEPGVPIDLQTICLKALEKSPRNRYQSAGHMAADLRSYLDGRPILARPAGPARRLWRRVHTRRAALGALGLGAAGLATGAIWGVRERDDRAVVRVLAAPQGARICAALYDASADRFGEPEALGGASSAHRLPPGYYRIVILTPETVAECARVLSPGETVVLSPRHLPTSEVAAEMLRIPPGEQTAFPTLNEEKAAYLSRVRGLGGFWIDRTEVSNGAYREFLEATGRPAPALWTAGEFLDEFSKWAHRPVVGISFYDAQAYAEWAGKRLPTYSEWQRAARGVDGRRFPWGDEGRDDEAFVRARANAWLGQTASVMRWDGTTGHRDLYLAHTRDVEDVAGLEDVSPDGLLHILGNVSEWTESLLHAPGVDGMETFPRRRLIAGVGWGDMPGFRRDLTGGAEDMASETFISRGFRCAKSDLDGA